MTAQLFDFPAIPAPAPKAKKLPQKKAYTGEFLAFWELYPARFNSSKFLAFKEWEKLDPEEQRQAMAAAPVYARRMRGKEQQFTKHAAHWLHGKYFETIAAPAAIHIMQSPVTPDWPAILRLYRMTSNWKADLYGPAPGYPGCRVPAELLGEML